MNIIIFGRTYWLLTAEEYELCAIFIEFLELEIIAAGEALKKTIPFMKRHDLFYGFAKKKGAELPIPSFFFQHKGSWFAIDITTRVCSRCAIEFDAVIARSHDLYWRADNIKEAFQWGLNLPYVDKCPNCGFDENGNGLKYLAIFYNGQVITALDN